MFSIIVCSHRPERTAFIAGHYAELFSAHDHEFIHISDARSLCEGYTRGLARAKGDLLIFSHDDIEFVLPNAALRIEQHLKEYDVIGIAGTTKLIDGAWSTPGDPYTYCAVLYPHADNANMYSVKVCGVAPLNAANMQALDGCFIACKREVAEAVQFDFRTFDGFHLYDLDFTFRAHLMGYKLAVCRDLPLIHASQGVLGDDWKHYKQLFEQKHRASLDSGEASNMWVVQSNLSREKLAPSMQNGMIEAMVDQLTKARARTQPAN